MALTGWSEANFLTAGPIWPGQLPFIYSLWCWKDNPGVNGWALSLGQAGTQFSERRSVVFRNSDSAMLAQSFAGGVAEDAVVMPAPNAEWYHVGAGFVSPTLREIWLDGGSRQTNTVSSSPAAPDSTSIGRQETIGPPWQNTGALASFSAWDAAGMTEPERDDLVSELAAGRHPLTLDLENSRLVDYAGLEDPNDLGPFAMQGSLSTFSSHPPVSAPTKSSTGFGRRGVRVITGADPQFPLPVRKHRQIVADPKYRRHILYQDPDAPIRRWVQVVPGPLPVRKHVSIEGL